MSNRILLWLSAVQKPLSAHSPYLHCIIESMANKSYLGVLFSLSIVAAYEGINTNLETQQQQSNVRENHHYISGLFTGYNMLCGIPNILIIDAILVIINILLILYFKCVSMKIPKHILYLSS